jgi:hydroxyacylglutathione hydrolase
MSPKLERIAEGVWRVSGDFRWLMNVFLIEDDGGVTQFDGGTKTMTKGVAAAAERLGGLKRIVLGHSHTDHRGTAPGLSAPVYCHPDEVADAESDGGLHYFDYSKVEFAPVRWIYPGLMRRWDGGPVKIAGTVADGDEVAGFRVIHFPGHAPGLIGLFRESDRLALVSDTVYLVDSARLKRVPEGEATVPHPFSSKDHPGARDSVRKLAELEPATVWTGHAEELSGPGVKQALLKASEHRFPRE